MLLLVAAHKPTKLVLKKKPCLRAWPFLLVCRDCSKDGKWKFSSQLAGGEVIAKRNGVAARRGLKEAWRNRTCRFTGTGSAADGAGPAGTGSRSPYPSRALVVYSAVACGSRSALAWEICPLSRNHDGGSSNRSRPDGRSQQREQQVLRNERPERRDRKSGYRRRMDRRSLRGGKLPAGIETSQG